MLYNLDELTQTLNVVSFWTPSLQPHLLPQTRQQRRQASRKLSSRRFLKVTVSQSSSPLGPFTSLLAPSIFVDGIGRFVAARLNTLTFDLHPSLILPPLYHQACKLLLTPIIIAFSLNLPKSVSSIHPKTPVFTPSSTGLSPLETIGGITATRSLSSSEKASKMIRYHSSLNPEAPEFKPSKQRLTTLVAANKSALSTETTTQEPTPPVSALPYTSRSTSLQPVRISNPDEQIMAGPSHAGLSSSRWAVSPVAKPKDEKTKPASNLVVNNDLQVQTNVHDRIANMTTRRPDPVESGVPKIATHEHHIKQLQENVPPNANTNTVSKDVKDHKVQDYTIESAQDQRGQVHTVRAESANVQPTNVQSVQAQAAQIHFRPVQETELFQVRFQTNDDDEQRLEESFMKNLKKNVERITEHNKVLESKRSERSVKFKLEDARYASEPQTKDKQGADILDQNIYSHQINDILKSNNRIGTETSKHTETTSDLMPTGKPSPQVQSVGMSGTMVKPSTKTSKMVHWDMELKKSEEAREKFELELQMWVNQHEQQRATLVRNRETWIQGRLEVEKARDEVQAMITQFDQEIEDRDKEYTSCASIYREILKNVCIEMACIAVSM